MDMDNDIVRIFSALDVHNQGFIDKNTFLDKLLHFLSSSDDIEDKVGFLKSLKSSNEHARTSRELSG